MQIRTKKKLNYLDETKGLIREAIEAKGQMIHDLDTFRSYAERIGAIETAGNPVLQPLEITENGTYTAPDGVDGYNPVTVDVPAPKIKLQDKTITENGEYTADSGFDGLGKVTVDVAGSASEMLPKMYTTVNSIPLNVGYSPNYFKLNGTLYSLCNQFNVLQSGEHTTSKYLIFKYVNGAWEQYNSTTYTLDFANAYAMKPVVLNQKAHFIGNSSKYHYIFDETNGLKKANALPVNASSYCVYTENGKLKILYSGKTYVWNESADTWSEEGAPPTNLCNEVVDYKGKTYWKASGDSIYVRENGVDTLVCKATDFGTSLCVKGGYIYSQSLGNIIRTDLATGASERVPVVSATSRAKFQVLEDDAPIWYYGFYRRANTDCTANYVVHEVF